VIAPLWLTHSLMGVRALVVALIRCGPCGQDMPADHTCTTTECETGPGATGPASDLPKEIHP
jgi:hypothetical protein